MWVLSGMSYRPGRFPVVSTPEGSRVRFTYRLRISCTARRALASEWGTCRWVWNRCVDASKAARAEGVECGAARLDKILTRWRAEHAWLGQSASVVQQQTIRDYAKSRAKALKDIERRLPLARRAGMPRYRIKHVSRPTLNYTRRGFRIKNGRLHLAGGITVTVVWSRELPGEPSSVRVYRDSLGHWYASFVVEAVTEPLPETGRVIGIDWGVADLATTTSDAHDLAHSQFGKTKAAKLARYQKMMARRKPKPGHTASKGYQAAKRQSAKVYAEVARQRTDTARKWAKTMVRDHDAIAVEDFKPKFLAKSTMARKAADAAISATKAVLIHMAEKHARVLHMVAPAHTTTDCARCQARTKLTLSQRTYTCDQCGHVAPRDKNSAHNMLIRAGLAPAGADRVRPTQPLVE